MKRVMQHRVFGRIDWNEAMERWNGRVQLDFFSAYDMAAAAVCAQRLGIANGQPTPVQDDQNGQFELELIGPGRTKPSMRQERAFLDFLKNRDLVCNRVVDAIFDYYRCKWGYWRAIAEPGREEFYADDLLIPELPDRDGLRSLIALLALSVLDVPGDDLGILGFCFACTWDQEHGLGALVHRGKIIQIGENDITWNLESAGRGSQPIAATPQQIAMQCGIAAAKKLGGLVTIEPAKDGGPSVQVDLVRNKQINDADLKSLNHFPILHQLKVNSDQATDSGLEVLQKFKNLQLLELSCARVTDAGLKELHGFKDLKVLYLCGTKVTDAGLKELRELPGLAGLYLNETNVTDVGLKEIQALTGLKYLGLSGTRVTDTGIQELKQLRALLNLDLQDTQVTDAGLTALKECKSLRYLNLSRCNVTDLGLEQLTGLNTLRSLKLESTATTDAGVEGLRQALTSLQVIRSTNSQWPWIRSTGSP
jgi:Leucine-rich repeat (LRR) protein